MITRDSLILLLLLLVAPSLFAAPYSWQTGGPWGGDMNDLRVDPAQPDRLYMTTRRGGIMRSDDGGSRWYRINNGIQVADGGITFFGLALHPGNGEIVYAASPDRPGGLWKSSDGGANWQPLTPAQSEIPAWEVAIDPNNPDNLYVAVADVVRGSGYMGRSTDGGRSWQKIVVGSPSNLVRHVAIDSFFPSVVYAGTLGAGIFRSIDFGKSWRPANGGLPAQANIFDLETDPHDPLVVYAVVQRDGIYKSTDAGISWKRLTDALPVQNFQTIEIHPTLPGEILAATTAIFDPNLRGVYKSTDGGSTWTHLPGSGLDSIFPYAVASHPDLADRFWVATHGEGVYRTDDGGTTFQFASEGVNAVFHWAIINDARLPGSVYTGTHDRFLRSSDFGATWEIIKLADNASFLYDFALDPSNPDRIYVACGTGIGRSEKGSGMYISEDRGNTWTLYTSGMGVTRNLTQVAADPTFSNVVWAGTADGVLYKSKTAGYDWTQVNLPDIAPTTVITEILIHPSDSRFVWVATSNRGLYFTSDRGVTWIRRATTPPLPVNTLAWDGVSGILYAGGGGDVGGLFRSTDMGQSWERVGNFLGKAQVEAIVVDPRDGNLLYVAVTPITADFEHGIYRSADGGLSWEPINGDIENSAVSALALDPSNPDRLYAATLGGSVFQSTGPAAVTR